MAWADTQREIFAKLNRIFGDDRQGTIDGVEFDLTNESLDPAEWQPPVVGMPPEVRSESSEEPFFWYHWFGVFDRKEVRRRALDHVERIVAFSMAWGGAVTPEERRQYLTQTIELATPKCVIKAGDKLVIYKVESIMTGDEFSHPHDKE